VRVGEKYSDGNLLDVGFRIAGGDFNDEDGDEMNEIICENPRSELFLGDCLEIMKTMPDELVDCCITSPPYWGLRDYGVEGQFGLEKTPEEYVTRMVEVFKEVKRVLKKEGTCWLNLGDSYAGNREKSGVAGPNATCGNTLLEVCLKFNKVSGDLKPKDLVGIPWRVAFALQADGWYLRQDIIWHKPNPMPESVTDRCTKAHEYIFLLAKSQKYYFDNEAIAEPANYDGRKDELFKGGVKYKGYQKQTMLSRGHKRWKKDENGIRVRNKRSVWTINTKPFKGAHFATFPENLVRPCILAGCLPERIVIDPFSGAGTVGVVAKKNNRNFIGIELNPNYYAIGKRRIQNTITEMF